MCLVIAMFMILLFCIHKLFCFFLQKLRRGDNNLKVNHEGESIEMVTFLVNEVFMKLLILESGKWCIIELSFVKNVPIKAEAFSIS